MALQILVNFQNEPVTYDVVMQEDNVYHLRLNGDRNACTHNGRYIPGKILIRKKGKIWISDMDNYNDLIEALTREISTFRNTAA